MEEKSNYDKQYEIVISFNKIWDNLLRYWWICLICFGIALAAVFGLSYRSYTSGRNALQEEVDLYKQDVANMENNKEDELKYIYIANSTVYMAREQTNLDTLISNSVLPDESYLEGRSDYIELYKEYMAAWLESTYVAMDKTLLYDCLALLYTDLIMDEINNQLISNGYEEYDKGNEVINMTLGNNARFYTLTLVGQDSERIEFILKTATDLLIGQTGDVLGIEYSRIVDQAVSKEYINWYGTHLLATDKAIELWSKELQKTVDSRRNAYTDAEGRLNNYSFSLGSLISTKNILILFVGIFMGLGIIFVLILLDKKIRNKDEIEMYFDYPVLGDVNEKLTDPSQYSVIAAALDYKCSNHDIKSILITGSENGEKTKAFADNIADELKKMGKSCLLIDINSSDTNIDVKIEAAKKKEGILIINAVDINKSSSAVKAAGHADAIIYVISANNESIPMIQKGINNIKIVSGNILGCLLIKSSKVFK